MIDFLKYRSFSVVFSCVIFFVFLGSLIYNSYYRNSAFNYSVDFTGGTQVLVKFDKPVTADEITKRLQQEYKGVVIREFSSTEFAIRIKDVVQDVKDLSQNISKLLQQDLSNNNVTIEQVDSVSGSMGQILRKNSLLAIFISLICMLAYIALRFRSFAFAAGAVGALTHDAIVILTYFLLLYKEIDISVIGAVLVVLGYSINDTIVIFARIRENMNAMPNKSLKDIVNLSLNETLSRTIKTSVATLLVVLALLLFGGQVLQGLSVALLIGMIFGTYSSIYMASPIMLAYKNFNKRYSH